MSNLEPRLLEIAGRAHMLLVHLPIGLILAAGVVELLGRGRKRPGSRSAARWCLGLGAISAVLAATTGWILADHVTLSRSLSVTLLLHRSTGIGTALVASLTWAISRPAGKTEGESNAFRIGLAAACGLVILTGHWGCTLVHGPGFLLAPLWEQREADDEAPSPGTGAAADEPVADVPGTNGETSEQPDFLRDVEPILAARCYECHGEARQKGHLRLDRLGELFEREDQTIVVAGDPDASELITRIGLPADDLDVMPAEGDPLSAAEIELLGRWIAAGASLGDHAGAPGD